MVKSERTFETKVPKLSSSKQPRQTNRIFPATKCSSQDHLDNASTRFHGSTKGPAVLGQSLRQLPAFVVIHGCEQSESSIEMVPQKHLTLKSIQADMSILDHFGHVTCRTSQKIPKILLPSRELTYPTLGKGNSSSKVPFWGDMLVPWRVFPLLNLRVECRPTGKNQGTLHRGPGDEFAIHLTRGDHLGT